tara:strand:+ start:428 stop:1534 length:1107 start_codon:yes stop_codon:yes gene_type:complete
MANTINLGNGDWATKEDSLLGYNNENAAYKPLPFDFTRASSGTVVNRQGLIETVALGLPRIDFQDNTNGSLLLEPQSTNLITYSEDFSDAIWTGGATNATVTASTNVNPSGNSGTYLVERVTGSQLGAVASVTAGLSYTGSIYVRNVSGSGAITLRDVNSVSTPFTATSEWQRFSVTGVATGAGRLYINVLTTGDIIEVWGAMLEQQSYATSYIPTEGTTVTKNQDLCNNGGSAALINNTEGVLYAEFSLLFQEGVTDRTIQLRGGGQDCRIRFLSAGTLRWTLIGNNTTIARSLTLVNTNINKVAIRYSSASADIWINGSLADTANNGMTYTSLDELTLDGFYSNTKAVAVYNTALSDQELQILTTI